MAAYHRFYDSRHPHVTCSLTAKNQDQLPNPMLGSRIWATFFLVSTAELYVLLSCSQQEMDCLLVYAQVCHRVEDDDAMGWLPAQVKTMKGEFVVIDYMQSTQMSATDVVNVDNVRIPSRK